jgi:DNA-directed RNA polymerase subunit RPC12/RpoP
LFALLSPGEEPLDELSVSVRDVVCPSCEQKDIHDTQLLYKLVDTVHVTCPACGHSIVIEVTTKISFELCLQSAKPRAGMAANLIVDDSRIV